MLDSTQGETISNQSVVSVLVVDDFAPWRSFIVEKLRENPNLRVIAAVSDGLEAVLQAEALQPGLILLDISLPKLDGIAAARQMRKLAPGSKILFLSQELDLDVARAALGAGGHGYLVKTDAESELLAAVQAVLLGKEFVSHSLVARALAAIGDPQPDGRFRREELIPGASSLSAKAGRCHEVHFYGAQDSLVDGFTPFISAALKAGNAAIVVATKPHRDELLKRLQAHGLDTGALTDQGRYIALDAAETLSTFMVNNLPDRLRFLKIASNLVAAAAKAANGEHPRVAACGECAPLLWAAGNAEAAIQLEHLWNEIANTYEVDILCGYEMKNFQREPDRQIYERICTEHSGVSSQWTGY